MHSGRDLFYKTPEVTRELRDYEDKHPGSRVLDRRARGVMPGGDTRSTTHHRPFPLYMELGRGCRLHDVDGNVYLDFLNNYSSAVLGHCHPAVTEAVGRCLGTGQVFGAGLRAQISLAELITERFPAVDTVRFCNSGTEATMFALRAARAFTGKDRIVKIEGGYHGTHDLACVSFKPPPPKVGDPRPVARVSPGVPASVGREVVVIPFNSEEALLEAMETHRDELAALVIEPYLGAAGIIPPREGYLARVRELCDAFGVLLIFDEIQSLRLSPGGAQEYYGVFPDITAMGKAIGGGYPVGAFGGRRDIMEIFSPDHPRPVSQGGTFNGNMATMVAGAATLEQLTEAECRRINGLGGDMADGLREALGHQGIRGQVTCVGSLLNVHLTAREGKIENYRHAARANRHIMDVLHIMLMNRGIFCAQRGAFNMSTPMVEDDVEGAVEVFAECLKTLRPAIERAFPEITS